MNLTIIISLFTVWKLYWARLSTPIPWLLTVRKQKNIQNSLKQLCVSYYNIDSWVVAWVQ